MSAFSIIGLPPDFMVNLTSFLLFCILTAAVFIMHRWHRVDERPEYPGMKSHLVAEPAKKQKKKKK